MKILSNWSLKDNVSDGSQQENQEAEEDNLMGDNFPMALVKSLLTA